MADRAAGAARATAVEPGVIARVSGALAVLRGKAAAAPADWFGPGTPLPATAPPEVAGRVRDYPFGTNMTTRRRDDRGVTFDDLRALADRHDLTRLAIETRKDQLTALPWAITSTDPDDPDAVPPPGLTRLFQHPDGVRPWATWLRRVVDECLVTDAVALWMQPTRGGQFFGARQVDGTLIKPVLDAWGETPAPPDPAYQQILKGLPAIDYTSEELLYRPRNPRVQTSYGFSPVEQVITTVNIALRRQASQLSYYDDGNIPAALISTPSTWSPSQIKEFQEYWDYLFSGEERLAIARQGRFVPGDVKAQLLKTEPLFDAADEWLARVVCYAFSLPPTAFTKQTNRATAETVQEAALEEGLAPLMQYIKALCDEILQAPFGLNQPGWQFTWRQADDTDQLTAAQVEYTLAQADALYLTNGVQTPKQIADRRGWEFDQAAADAKLAEQQAAREAQAAALTAGAQQKQLGPGKTADDAAPDTEAAKAAGRSLRRRHAQARY